ncbi:hypothetical protein ACSSS7_006444 [Eimeria intestinalis]
MANLLAGAREAPESPADPHHLYAEIAESKKENRAPSADPHVTISPRQTPHTSSHPSIPGDSQDAHQHPLRPDLAFSSLGKHSAAFAGSQAATSEAGAAATASRSTTPAATELPTSDECILAMDPTTREHSSEIPICHEGGGKLALETEDATERGGPLGDGGGDSTTLRGSSGEEEKQQSLLVPCLAVFSSNYNFVVTSIALYIMNQDADYKQTLESVVGNGTIKMLSYAGAIAGMCIMGYLGDLVGRRLAMIVTLFLVAFGALGSAALSWGSAVTVAIIVGVFRFVLGIGSGGVYPLSAVTAAEGSSSEKVADRCLRVSWAYSMNVPGILFPYLIAMLLWWATDKSVEATFRILLGFGALPAFLVWLPTWRMKDSKEYVERDFAAKLLQVFVNRTYWRQLLGTGVCWLLYDVTAYGILLVQPELTHLIWGKESSVYEVIWHNIVLNAIGIPGCYMGILVLRQMGVKWLQFWGFMGLAGSAFLLAALAQPLQGNAWAQLALLAIVNFFINWGASITTFILPSVVFPPSVRSTYSGISAALGKVGAVGGIYLMKAALSSWGLAPMMICAGLPSLIAAFLTFFYVSPTPNSATSALAQCFGSLGGCLPFVDCRRRKVA